MSQGLAQYQNGSVFQPGPGGCASYPGAALSSAPPPPRMLTIPERLEVIEGSLYELVNTLARTEDSLVGPRPCDPANKAENMPSIDSSLLRIARQLELAHESANSIHRQIVRQ